jgi:hypothetical protein
MVNRYYCPKPSIPTAVKSHAGKNVWIHSMHLIPFQLPKYEKIRPNFTTATLVTLQSALCAPRFTPRGLRTRLSACPVQQKLVSPHHPSFHPRASRGTHASVPAAMRRRYDRP